MTVKSESFRQWFGDSQVVDAEGNPLVVYRGEHGESAGRIHTRLAAITFGSIDAAKTYATRPNNPQDGEPKFPRVLSAYLKIDNPIVNDESDPFLDAAVLICAIGLEKTSKILKRFASQVKNTNNWEELSGQYGIDDVGVFIDQHPDKVALLYLEAYHLLDDAEVVSALKDAGYDGAIHGGSGETALDAEYKVFDVDQIKFADECLNLLARDVAVDRPARNASGFVIGGGQKTQVKNELKGECHPHSLADEGFSL